MPVNLPKAMEAISWTTDATQRLLTFLYMFKFRCTPEGFVAGVARTTNGAEAKAAVVEHGAPVRILQHFYKDVRLVTYNKIEC